MIAVQHHSSEELLRRIVDQFDRLYAESAAITRIMSLSLHPYLSGVPHRIRYIEAAFEHMSHHEGVLFWTGDRIFDWYRAVAR